MQNWKEFVLNFCLDVADSFKTWTSQKTPIGNFSTKGTYHSKTDWKG